MTIYTELPCLAGRAWGIRSDRRRRYPLAMTVNLDEPSDDDLDVIRGILRPTLPVDSMSDDELVRAMRERLEAQVPAPPVRAGSPPVNARVWLHEALTAGGFAEPEDKFQTAELGDGGAPIDLGVLAALVMRHTSPRDDVDFGDQRLSRELGQPISSLQRGQTLLDEIAVLVGRPATPRARWWLDVEQS